MDPALIVAAQPTLDRTIVINHFEKGVTYRISSVTELPSGKALNVARSLHYLDHPVNVMALLGGYTGQWMLSQLNQIGINTEPIWVRGDNRMAYSIYDPINDELTELIEDTDRPITEENWHSLVSEIEKSLPYSSSLILSGRGPEGFPDAGYKLLIQKAKRFSKPIYLDSYGPLLYHAIQNAPTVVKINQKEAGEIVGFELSSLQDCVDAVKKIRSFGVKIAAITMGKDGALVADDQGVWSAVPPSLPGSAVGSGDSFLAGFVYGTSQNWPIDKSLRYAVAAGSANLLVPGAGLFNKKDLLELVQKIRIEKL